jgi:outer membrane lipase/esterase
MKTTLRTRLATVCACALASVALGQRTFTNQYTFGDSLSDNGNVRAATGGAVNGGAPYFGGRWSNGPVFAERLGNTLAVGATAPASVKSSMGFAFGGATAVPSTSTVPFPPIAAQVQLFQSHAVSIQRTDLFTLWIGANDILNTMQQPTTPGNPGNMDIAGINAAQTAATAVQSLITMGAKNIVVLNLPDIGRTPAIPAAGSPFATRGSLAYNTEFDARLAPIASAAADVNLVRIDTRAIIDRVLTDYRLLGFSNASSGLILPAAAGGGGDPEGYVFWDGLHPTAKTHALLAAMITEALNPESVVGWAATEGSAALALGNLGQGAINARLMQLVKSQRPTGRADVYTSFNYGDGERTDDGFRPKFDYTGQVVMAGIDLRLSDGVFVGGALNVGRVNVDVSGGRGNFTIEDTGGRLYAVWRGGPVSLLADGDYAALNVKGIHRTTAFGGLQTNGKTAGTRWGVGLTAAWNIDMGNGFEVRPLLGVRTSRVELDRYTEKDIPAIAMDFEGQDARDSAGLAGIEASAATKLGGRATHFDFRAVWHGDIGTHTRQVSGRLSNNFTRPTVLTVEDGDGSGVEVGAALTFFAAKNTSFSLGYAGDIRSGDKLSSRASISFQTGF